MDHARHLTAVLCLDRQAEAPVSLCDDGILQIRPGGTVDERVQLYTDVVVCLMNLTAHLAKSRTCIVGDLILRENAARDLGGKRRERLQAGKHGFQGIFRCIFGFVSCASGPGFDTQRRLKKTADTKQFFDI